MGVTATETKGELDDERAECGSARGGMDDEIARALAGDQAMRSAARLLVECVKEDQRLARFVNSVDAAAFERQVGELMRQAFNGADWPMVKVKRPLVAEHLPGILEAIWEVMNGPLPLGEDTLVAAFARLTKAAAEGKCDRRISNFFEGIRDLLFVAHSPRAKAPVLRSGLVRTSSVGSIQSVVGLWQCSQNNLCIVSEDICTSISGKRNTVAVAGGAVQMDGWKVTQATPTQVKWEKAGQGMTWTRFTTPKDIEPLVGVWKNSDDLICVVAEGECHFTPKGSPPLKLQDGYLVLNGWAAVSITDRQVCWVKKGEKDNKMDWNRIREVGEVEALNGKWSTSDGHQCQVVNGTATFLDMSSTTRLSMTEGLPSLNSWRAVAVKKETVVWKKGTKTLVWTRI